MINRIGLRARLTLFVTAVFAAALSLLSVLTLNAAEDDLVANTRSNAEGVLGNYLDANSGGVSSVAVVDPTQATRFFYLDGDGIEVSEDEFFEALFAFDEQFSQQIEAGFNEAFDDISLPLELEDDSELADDRQLITLEQAPDDQILYLDPETGEFLDTDGEIVILDLDPVPEGPPHSVQMGEGVVAVAQTLKLADGTLASIGVSSPLQPVTDSLNTIRRLLWLAVPLLSAITAVITWLAASRALKPVTELTLRAQAIGAANIGDRLPVPPAQDEIRELATTMNAMLSRLDQSQRQQRQFISDASHELRSPVAASRVQLEVAQASPTDTDWNKTTKVVLAEQKRLSSLIDDLLALSRLDEAGTGKVGDIDLDDLVSVEARRQQEVDVRVSVPEPVRITGNLELLTSAIRNLLDNASRHARSCVVVTLASVDNKVVLHIDDDGPGIEVESRQAVFERFTRLDEARDRPSGGSGLGLAIAREVARAHGGDVVVSTSPLGGARFTLELPLGS